MYFLIPKYLRKDFDTEEEFYSYLSAEDYNTDNETAGVCFGIGMNKTADNKYSTKIYFNDQSFLGSRFAYGIPP